MYTANPTRYGAMLYNRCGKSGLKLPALSLGLWQNFGTRRPYEDAKEMILGAFDMGLTHFDLANNYGPPFGSAEITLGRVLQDDLRPYRDELIISTKAGFSMWDGPYGAWGSKKHLIASCEQSLKRLGLDYVDIFYHHRPDPDTPIEESMEALYQLWAQGKALYVGISNYGAEDTKKAQQILKERGVRLLIHQVRYNMLDRHLETDGVLDVLSTSDTGAICFSPLAQGMLTNRYLDGIPKESRAASGAVSLKPEAITQALLDKASKLQALAAERGQSLAQMALAWTLRNPTVCSAIIGASSLPQIQENIQALGCLDFSAEELAAIDQILGQEP